MCCQSKIEAISETNCHAAQIEHECTSIYINVYIRISTRTQQRISGRQTGTAWDKHFKRLTQFNYKYFACPKSSHREPRVLLLPCTHHPQGSGARRTLSFLSVVPIVLDQRVAGKQSAISSCCRSTGCSCIALPTHLAQNKEQLIRLLVTCVCLCVCGPQRSEDFPRPDSMCNVCMYRVCLYMLCRSRDFPVKANVALQIRDDSS